MIVITDGENQNMADIPAAPTHHVQSPDTNVTPKSQYDADVAKANEWTLEACAGGESGRCGAVHDQLRPGRHRGLEAHAEKPRQRRKTLF